MNTIGVTAWMLDTDGVDAVRRANELGFEAIELGIFSMEDYKSMHDSATQAAYLEAASANDIKLAGMMTGIFSQLVALHNQEQEALIWKIFSDLIDVASALKIELITIAIFGDFGIKNAEEMARTSAMLRRACEYVGDRPMQIATESTLSIQENRALIDQVNHPKLRVMMDAYNGVQSNEYNAAAMVHDLHDVLCNVVHAKDGPDEALIGQVNGDFLATAQALKGIGFDGYIISESQYKTGAGMRAAADLATLKRIFEKGT